MFSDHFIQPTSVAWLPSPQNNMNAVMECRTDIGAGVAKMMTRLYGEGTILIIDITIFKINFSLMQSHQKIQNVNMSIGRYTNYPHARDRGNVPGEENRQLLMKKTKTDWKEDGLSNLSYALVGNVTLHKTHTHILVDLKQEESWRYVNES